MDNEKLTDQPERPPGQMPVDGSHVWTVDSEAVRDMTDERLHALVLERANRTGALLEEHNQTLGRLIRNEQNLAILTHELNRRRAALVLPGGVN